MKRYSTNPPRNTKMYDLDSKVVEKALKKPIKLGKKQILVSEVAVFYEELINLENKMGNIVFYNALEKATIESLRKEKIKLSKKGFHELFFSVMATGLILVPRGGFIVRTSNWKIPNE